MKKLISQMYFIIKTSELHRKLVNVKNQAVMSELPLFSPMRAAATKQPNVNINVVNFSIFEQNCLLRYLG